VTHAPEFFQDSLDSSRPDQENAIRQPAGDFLTQLAAG